MRRKAGTACRALTNSKRCDAMESIEESEQSVQDGFLHIHAVLRLIEYDRLRAVENFGSDFEAAVRRKTVHKGGVGSGKSHQFGIDLVGREDGFADIFLGFETHAGPGIRVDGLGTGHGFAGIRQELNLGPGFPGDALGVCQDYGQRLIIRGSGDAQMNAEARGEIDQGMANVISVADIGELETPKRAESFLESKKIGQRLAGMKFIRESVDVRNCCVGGHFLKYFLFVDASDDAVDPAIEIAGDIGDGFTRAERGGSLGVVEKNDGAAHALDSDVKSDTSAERGFFENQSDKFSGERGSVATGPRLDVGGKLKQVAGVRGAPFRSGEQVSRQGNGSNERSSGHFSFHLAAARAACDGVAEFAGSEAAALRGVVTKIFSRRRRNWRTCTRVTRKGGRKRNVESCVQLISRPRRMASAT